MPSLSLTKVANLTFFEPDEEKFRCLKLAKQAMRDGGTMPAVLNAANEIAVQQFLDRKIGFTQIPALVEETLQGHSSVTPRSLQDIVDADGWARRRAAELAAA